MAAYDQGDLREGQMTTEIGKIQSANLQFKDTITIAADDTFSDTGNYTTNSGTSSTTRFDGDLKRKNIIEQVLCTANHNLSEIDNIRPSKTYVDTTWPNMIYKMIIETCNVITFNDITLEGYFYEISTFNDDTSGTTPDWFDTIILNGGTVLIDAAEGDHNYCVALISVSAAETSAEYDFTAAQTSGTVEYYARTADAGGYPIISLGDIQGPYILSTGGIWKAFDGGGAVEMIAATVDTWYHFRIDFECGAGAYKGLAADTYQVYINGIQYGPFAFIVGKVNFSSFYVYVSDSSTVYVDSIGFSWDTAYSIGMNLNLDINDIIKLPTTPEYPVQTFVLQGDKTVKQYFEQYCDFIYAGWYVNPSNQLTINDLDVDSGVDISAGDMEWVKGVQQIESIDQVILHGFALDGTKFTVTSGTGNNIFKDTYAHISDEPILQATADNLLTSKGLNAIELKLFNYRNATAGMLQVGETVTVNAGITFKDSSVAVPSGQYIIKRIYNYDIRSDNCTLILMDGLVFTHAKPLWKENSYLIEKAFTLINSTSGGLPIYLHQDASDIGGGYLKMCTDYPDDVKTEVMNTTITADDQELKVWATPAGCPGITEILEGFINLHCHTYKFSGTKEIQLYFKLYKRVLAGTETLLATSYESTVLETAEAEEDLHAKIDYTVLLTTDRLVLKVYGNLTGTGSNPVIYFYVEGETGVRLQLPVPSLQASDIVDNTAYDATMDGDITHAASRNVIYDKIELDKTKRKGLTLFPSNLVTAGNNNCYWNRGEGDEVRFGTTATTGGGFLGLSFRVPEDYKLGTDIKLVFQAHSLVGSVAQVDSLLYAASKGNNVAVGWEMSAVVNALSPTSFAAHNTYYVFEITLLNATCSFAVNESVHVAFSMDDNAASRVIVTTGWEVEYTSDNLD